MSDANLVVKNLAALANKFDLSPIVIDDAVELIGVQEREIAALKKQLEFSKDFFEKALNRCVALEGVYNDAKKQLAKQEERIGNLKERICNNNPPTDSE